MEPSQSARSGAEPAALPPRPSSATNNENNSSRGTRLLDAFLTLLIPGLVLAHLVVAPYTKVEESFNIQATHDVLVYGTPTSYIHDKLSTFYDHFTFPGAVPRTFIGPVLLAGLAQPIVALVGFQHAQFVVRAILGLFNAACLLVFSRNLRRAYGAGTARCYLLLQASQFHVIFYASRTLPNMFAFGLTTLAFAFLLPHPTNTRSTLRRQRVSITMFVFAAAIFRSEVALLLGTTILHQLTIPSISLERVLFPFTASFLTALATSIPIDSYFWQRPLWPELWGFYYNVVRGAASNWGVSPWHYYFTSALPRLLVNPLTYTLLIPYSLYHPALRRAASRLLVPSLLFTAIYSLQPHKEARFIFYVVPPLTAAAALAANHLLRNTCGNAKSKSESKPSALASTLLAALLALSIAASFAASTAMLAISALNYPGGDALAHLRAAILCSPSAAPLCLSPAGDKTDQGTTQPEDAGPVMVHADVLSCMTGVTLFGSSTAASLADAPVVFPLSSNSSSQDMTGDDSETVQIKQHSQAQAKSQNPHGSEPDHHQDSNNNDNNNNNPKTSSRTQIFVDKTEDPALLRDPAFWRQFSYILTENPAKIAAVTGRSGSWETLGVVRGYAGIEVLRPGDGDDDDSGTGRGGEGAPPRPVVLGLGRAVARWRGRVRALTGGWWAGPRMADKVYILRRARGVAAGGGRRVVDTR